MTAEMGRQFFWHLVFQMPLKAVNQANQRPSGRFFRGGICARGDRVMSLIGRRPEEVELSLIFTFLSVF